MALHIETFPVGPLGCNCSILSDDEKKTAIVVDPGGDLEGILARIDARQLRVEAIVHTHTHIDHVGATAGLQAKTGARAMIHEADRFLYDMLPVQAAMIGIPLPERTDMEGALHDGSTIGAAAIETGILHTPGHTPGSVSFVVGSFVLTGDTLFRQGIGRTDLWGGDHAEIMRSLKNKLLTLPDDTVVITGHGPKTTIGDERRKNPFLR